MIPQPDYPAELRAAAQAMRGVQDALFLLGTLASPTLTAAIDRAEQAAGWKPGSGGVEIVRQVCAECDAERGASCRRRRWFCRPVYREVRTRPAPPNVGSGVSPPESSLPRTGLEIPMPPGTRPPRRRSGDIPPQFDPPSLRD